MWETIGMKVPYNLKFMENGKVWMMRKTKKKGCVDTMGIKYNINEKVSSMTSIKTLVVAALAEGYAHCDSVLQIRVLSSVLWTNHLTPVCGPVFWFDVGQCF